MSTKQITLALFLAIPALLTAHAQDLPSAPSAVKQQQIQPQPTALPVVAPTQAPANTATASPTPAQVATDANTNSDDSTNPEFTIRKQVEEVNVVFTATDKHGHFVKDLQQSEIAVLDDKKPPEKISNFFAQTNMPLRVGLLIDISSSIRDRFKFEQEAAIEFLNQIIRPRVDKALVLGFDTTSDITQDFTPDTEKLAKGVRALRPG